MSKLSRNIKYLRKKNKYSQIELASVLGLSQTSVAHYEKGTRQPSIETLMDLSQLFEEPIDSLVGNLYKKKKTDNSIELEQDILIKQLIDALIEKDEDKFSLIINQSLIPYFDIYRMVDTIFTDLMYYIGDLWEKGEISEADEHYASNLVRKVFHSIEVAHNNLMKTRKAISFTVGSEKHTLGIEMINACLQAEGIETLYLGSDLPIRSIEKVIKENDTDYIFISITMSDSMNSLVHLVNYIVEKYKDDVAIGLGGQGLRHNRDLLQYENVHILKNVKELLKLIRHEV